MKNKGLFLWLIFVAASYLLPWWNRVYFLWDDIELLMLLKFQPLTAFFLSHEYQFFPLFQLFYWLEIQLFGVNPSLFLLTSVGIHLINIFLAYELTLRLTKSDYFSLLAAVAVGFNKSFFEIVFWPTMQSNLLLTTSSLVAIHLYLSLIKRYSYAETAMLFISVIVGNFLFGFGIPVGLILASTAAIFLKSGPTKKAVPLLGTAAAAIGIGAVLLFSTAELRLEEKLPTWSINQIENIIYFAAVGPSQGIAARFFLPGFTPNIYSRPNILIMILIPAILTMAAGSLTYFIIKRHSSWKQRLWPLFLFYSLTVSPYVVAALARSVGGAHKALADRYVYYPLFFFVLALIYSLSILPQLNADKNKFFRTLTLEATLIIAIGQLIAMTFQTNLLFR